MVSLSYLDFVLTCFRLAVDWFLDPLWWCLHREREQEREREFFLDEQECKTEQECDCEPSLSSCPLPFFKLCCWKAIKRIFEKGHYSCISLTSLYLLYTAKGMPIVCTRRKWQSQSFLYFSHLRIGEKCISCQNYILYWSAFDMILFVFILFLL